MEASAQPSQGRTFTQVVQEARRGGLHGDLTEQLAELVKAVNEHGKSGTLTLTLKVSPAKAPGALVITDEVKLKAPEAEKDASLFFPDEDGNLHRSDPRQLEFEGPLREVPRDGGGEPREVSA